MDTFCYNCIYIGQNVSFKKKVKWSEFLSILVNRVTKRVHFYKDLMAENDTAITSLFYSHFIGNDKI